MKRVLITLLGLFLVSPLFGITEQEYEQIFRTKFILYHFTEAPDSRAGHIRYEKWKEQRRENEVKVGPGPYRVRREKLTDRNVSDGRHYSGKIIIYAEQKAKPRTGKYEPLSFYTVLREAYSVRGPHFLGVSETDGTYLWRFFNFSSIHHPTGIPMQYRVWAAQPQDPVILSCGILDDDFMYDMSDPTLTRKMCQNREGVFLYVYDDEHVMQETQDWALHNRLAFGYESSWMPSTFIAGWTRMGETNEGKNSWGAGATCEFSYGPLVNDINHPVLRALRVRIWTRMYLAKLRIARCLVDAPAWNATTSSYVGLNGAPHGVSSQPLQYPQYRHVWPDRPGKTTVSTRHGNRELFQYLREWHECYFDEKDRDRPVYSIRNRRLPFVDRALTDKTFFPAFRSDPSSYTWKFATDKYLSLAVYTGTTDTKRMGSLPSNYLSPKAVYPDFEGVYRRGHTFVMTEKYGKQVPLDTAILHAGYVSGSTAAVLWPGKSMAELRAAAKKGPFMTVSYRTYQKYGHAYFERLAQHRLVTADVTGALIDSNARVWLNDDPDYVDAMMGHRLFYVGRGGTSTIRTIDTRVSGARAQQVATRSGETAEKGNMTRVNYYGTWADAKTALVGRLWGRGEPYPQKPGGKLHVPVTVRAQLDSARRDIQAAWVKDLKEFPDQCLLTKGVLPSHTTGSSSFDWYRFHRDPTSLRIQWKTVPIASPDILFRFTASAAMEQELVRMAQMDYRSKDYYRKIITWMPEFTGNPHLFRAYAKHRKLMALIFRAFAQQYEDGYILYEDTTDQCVMPGMIATRYVQDANLLTYLNWHAQRSTITDSLSKAVRLGSVRATGRQALTTMYRNEMKTTEVWNPCDEFIPVEIWEHMKIKPNLGTKHILGLIYHRHGQYWQCGYDRLLDSTNTATAAEAYVLQQMCPWLVAIPNTMIRGYLQYYQFYADRRPFGTGYFYDPGCRERYIADREPCEYILSTLVAKIPRRNRVSSDDVTLNLNRMRRLIDEHNHSFVAACCLPIPGQLAKDRITDVWTDRNQDLYAQLEVCE